MFIEWTAGERCPACGKEALVRSTPTSRLGQPTITQTLICLDDPL